MVMRLPFQAPRVGDAFSAGVDAALSNKLAQAQDMRAQNALDLRERAQEFGELDANRNFDFRVEGRDYDRRQRELAAQRAAAARAAAQQRGIMDENREAGIRLTETMLSLPEGSAARQQAYSRLLQRMQAGGVNPGQLGFGPEIPSDEDLTIALAELGGEAPQAPEPIKVGDRLVIPDGQGGFREAYAPPPDPGYSQLSPEEVERRNLDPGAYQISPKGQITAIGGGGQNITVENNMQPDVQTTGPMAGMAIVDDPDEPTGKRAVFIEGTPAANTARNAVQQAEQTLSVAQQLASFPNLERYVGPVDSRTPDVSPEAREFQRLVDQIGGQTFMQAIEGLRGTGVISDIEGQKGSDALSRISRELNAPAFRRAVNDFVSATETMRNRGQDALGASGLPVGGPGGVVIGGETYGEGTRLEIGGIPVTVRNGLLEDAQGRMYRIQGDTAVPAY